MFAALRNLFFFSGSNLSVETSRVSAKRRQRKRFHWQVWPLETRCMLAAEVGLGGYPEALSSGDFDGDGILDLVTANTGKPDEPGNTISVLLGGNGGTFPVELSYEVGDMPQSVTTGDLNGDGRLDLATANAKSGNVSVLLGNGDGTFKNETLGDNGEPIRPDVGKEPWSVTTGDFDGNGHLDLATANFGEDTISLLLGKGDGSFQDQVKFTVKNKPRSVTVGQFNDDNKDGLIDDRDVLDLATANFGPNSISIMLGEGDGSFAKSQTVRHGRINNVGESPWSLTAGDFNGDGNLDLATANSGSNDVSVFIGLGDGNFDEIGYPMPIRPQVGTQPRSVTADDFDGDGILDLATANAGSDDLTVLLGNGDGTFETQPALFVRDGLVFVTTGQFNDDNLDGVINNGDFLDLAAVTRNSHSVLVLQGRGNGDFDIEEGPIPVGNVPGFFVTGQFNDDNGDGVIDDSDLPDLASANYASDDVSVLLGGPDGSFQQQRRFAVADGPYGLTAGHFNDDSGPGGIPDGTIDEHDFLDLATANFGADNPGNTLSLLLGVGDGTFRPPTTVRVGLLFSVPASASVIIDLDQMTVPDVLRQQFEPALTSNVKVVTAESEWQIEDKGEDDIPPRLFKVEKEGGTLNIYRVLSPRSVATGDFDGDGKLDLVTANFGTAKDPGNTVSVLLGGGDGTLNEKLDDQGERPIVGDKPWSVTTGDFDGDGHLDLATANFGTVESPGNTVSVLLGNGDGTFTERLDDEGERPSVGDFPRSVTSSDFNGDGIRDLATANVGSNVSVLLGNGDGTFESSTLRFGFGATAITARDLNGDGRIDLVTANGNSNDSSILLGSHGRRALWGIWGSAVI